MLGLALNESYLVLGSIAVAACLGHMFPLYYGFKGGKGVATTLGAITPLSMNVASGLVGLWVIAFGISRYSSLASIIAALGAPAITYYFAPHYLVPICMLTVLVLFKHKTNIIKLYKGTEYRFPEKEESDQGG
mgnify:CR=1 FL=1